jgi:hypothetical protein
MLLCERLRSRGDVGSAGWPDMEPLQCGLGNRNVAAFAGWNPRGFFRFAPRDEIRGAAHDS